MPEEHRGSPLACFNVLLPDDVPVGDVVPIVLTPGTANSPATITAAIAGR